MPAVYKNSHTIYYILQTFSCLQSITLLYYTENVLVFNITSEVDDYEL